MADSYNRNRKAQIEGRQTLPLYRWLAVYVFYRRFCDHFRQKSNSCIKELHIFNNYKGLLFHGEELTLFRVIKPSL